MYIAVRIWIVVLLVSSLPFQSVKKFADASYHKSGLAGPAWASGCLYGPGRENACTCLFTDVLHR